MNVHLLNAEASKFAESDAIQITKRAVAKTNKISTKVFNKMESVATNNPVSLAARSALSRTLEFANNITRPVMESKTVQLISNRVKSLKSELAGHNINPYFVEYRPKEIRDVEKASYLSQIYKSEERLIGASSNTSLVLSKYQNIPIWDTFKNSIETLVNEGDEALAIRTIRKVEPTFKKTEFLQEFARFNIPDILEGLVTENMETLRRWLSAEAFAKVENDFNAHQRAGLTSNCKIVDYRACDINRMLLIENELPVVTFKFQTTEISSFKNKEGKVTVGAEDKLKHFVYYFMMTKSNFINSESTYDSYTNNWSGAIFSIKKKYMNQLRLLQRPIQRATNVFAKQQVRQVNVLAEFAKSVKRQVEENKDFQKDVKMLSAETEKVVESEAMKNAKKAVTATSEATSKVIGAVGSAVEATMNNPVVKATGEAISKTAETVAEVTQKVAEPILETKAAKTVAKGVDSIKKDVVGIAGNAYFAEYKPKDVRDKEKEELMAKRKVANPADEFGIPRVEGPIEENADASGVVLHKSSKFNEAWEKFKQDSPIAQKLFSFSKTLEENDSSVMRFWRNLREKTVIEESETVQVIRAIRAVEPTFNQNDFLQETAHFVIPDLLEAYLKGEEALLQEWLTEGAYASIAYGFKAQKEAGLVSDCKLVDYRNCEIEKMMLLEEETPIILVKFSTTEILLFRNKKGDIALGAEDQLQSARYVLAFTKTKLINPDAEYNPKTNGWTIVQWARAA
ncbi:protein translocase subunit [Boothiomyces sp. JEL0866]|nr:protein translocase subunit [Boothiomyces sp. JEL0866]